MPTVKSLGVAKFGAGPTPIHYAKDEWCVGGEFITAFSAGTQNALGHTLRCKEDGNLEIVEAGSARVLWASNLVRTQQSQAQDKLLKVYLETSDQGWKVVLRRDGWTYENGGTLFITNRSFERPVLTFHQRGLLLTEQSFLKETKNGCQLFEPGGQWLTSSSQDAVGLRGGVIIIGSLFWQNHLENKDQDGIRADWRNKCLDMQKAVKIRFPMDYGRKSNSGIITMTTMRDYELGTAWLIPFNHTPTPTVADLIDETCELARAEGMQKNGKPTIANGTWGTIAIGFPPDEVVLRKLPKDESANIPLPVEAEWNQSFPGQLDPKAREALRSLGDKRRTITDYWRVAIEDTGGHGAFWSKEEPDLKEWAAFDAKGVLRVLGEGKWLQAVESKDQPVLDNLDFVLCTITKPTGENANAKNPLDCLPSHAKFVDSVDQDHDRQYFYNNHHCGIQTKRDEVILEVIRARQSERAEDTPAPEYKPFVLKPGQSRFSRGIRARLRFDMGRLEFSFDGKVEWSSATTKSAAEFEVFPNLKGGHAAFQTDANLVLYNCDPPKSDAHTTDPYWASGTWSRYSSLGNPLLKLGDAPHFEITRPNEVPWRSDAQSPRPSPPPPTPDRRSEDKKGVSATVNGRLVSFPTDPRVSLLDLLREHQGLSGTKKGCNQGACGACTVLVDGSERILSCLALAVQYEGRSITTIEGLADDDTLHPLQQAFIDCDGFQCGYCTPGQICSAIGMLAEIKRGVPSHVTADLAAETIPLDHNELRERMSGNLCRCGAYNGIVAAISEAFAGKTAK